MASCTPVRSPSPHPPHALPTPSPCPSLTLPAPSSCPPHAQQHMVGTARRAKQPTPADVMDACVVVMQRSVCFPLLIKQTQDAESGRMSMKEAVVQNLAGPVSVVRIPPLPVPTTRTRDGRKERIPSAAADARMVTTLAASAQDVPTEIDSQTWRALKTSRCCRMDKRRLLQLYRRALAVAKAFPCYTISSAVKKLRIKPNVVNSKVRSAVTQRVGTARSRYSTCVCT